MTRGSFFYWGHFIYYTGKSIQFTEYYFWLVFCNHSTFIGFEETSSYWVGQFFSGFYWSSFPLVFIGRRKGSNSPERTETSLITR